ncbi:MAG: SDR family NAD(P)-dependent oxidoreductase [Acetobacter sp.]
MFEENKDSRQKVAVVSGASGGIGRALCGLLQKRGYRVIALVRQKSQPQDADCMDSMVVCDLMDTASIAQAAQALQQSCDHIDLFVFCAGAISPQPVATLQNEPVMEQVQINLVGVMLLTNAILPAMAAGSHIVYTNSMAGIFPLAGSSVYTASKFGLRGFALALEQELRPRGIRVSSIFPGSVNTTMLLKEMEQGGSVLNFMSAPREPEAIAEWILASSGKGRVESFPSSVDSFFCSLFLWSPRFLRLCMPLMTMWAKAGRARYRKMALKNQADRAD